MAKSKIIKFFIVSCCFIFCFTSVFGQEATIIKGQDIYSQIDVAFLDKSPETVSRILSSTLSDVNYVQYEEYVLQKTKALLLSNQLDLIQSMCMAVIDNNLDNTDAVNLYMTVEKSVAKRNARQKVIEEQRKQEAEYVAQASTQKKEAIRQDYNIAENVESGQTLFVAPVVSSYYSDFTWTLAFNIAEIGLRFSNNTNSVNYGVGLIGDFYYRAPRFSLGTDVYIDASVLNFTKADIGMSEISLVPGLSFVKLNEDLFFRLGFSYMTLSNGDKFITPVVGLSLKNIQINNMRLGFYADYYPGHLAVEDMLAAIGFGCQTSFNLGNIGNINLGLFFSLRETLLIETTGVDSRTRFTIGLGVESNE